MDQLSGVLVTRKPEGMNSRQFGVDEAKSFIAKQDLKPMKRKIGHLGTLDPFASGVLPVMIGSATKLGNHLMLEPKRYKATLKLGYETDTGDHTGTLVDNDLAKVTIDDLMLRDVESSMTGSIKQIPPKYSAIRINGKRAYDLVRAGAEFEVPERTVKVFALKCELLDESNIFIDCEVGNGTYIRTLAEDIAKKLGTRGHLVALERCSVGSFKQPGFFDAKTLLQKFFPQLESSSGLREVQDCLETGKRIDSVLTLEHKDMLLLNPDQKYALTVDNMPLALIQRPLNSWPKVLFRVARYL